MSYVCLFLEYDFNQVLVCFVNPALAAQRKRFFPANFDISYAFVIDTILWSL